VKMPYPQQPSQPGAPGQPNPYGPPSSGGSNPYNVPAGGVPPGGVPPAGAYKAPGQPQPGQQAGGYQTPSSSAPNPYGPGSQVAGGGYQAPPSGGAQGGPSPAPINISPLLAAIDAEKYASKKLEAFSNGLNNLPPIPCSQARELVGKFTYASDQLAGT
jgi:hypothetical protein